MAVPRRPADTLRRGGLAAWGLMMGVGGRGLLGGGVGLPGVPSLLPGWIAMVPNTALLLLLAGLALWQYHQHAGQPQRGRHPHIPIAAVGAGLVGTALVLLHTGGHRHVRTSPGCALAAADIACFVLVGDLYPRESLLACFSIWRRNPYP